MNRIYSLIWNRALKTLQVASELTRGSRGNAGSIPVRHSAIAGLPLAIASVLATASLWVALPAAAATCPPGSTAVSGTGANGNNGTNGSYGSDGSSGSPAYNGYTIVAGAPPLCVAANTAAVGGNGGSGGSGGYSATGTAGDGGKGGNGGAGISGSASGLENNGAILGGNGGDGGAAGVGLSGGTPIFGNEGNGGNGGDGVSGAFTTLGNSGGISGGNGGVGGGNGGAGINASSASADGLTLTTSGTIAGGNGGSGTNGALNLSATSVSPANNGGNGGYGGAALAATGASLDITAGSIVGGTGGAGGNGGAALGNSNQPAFGYAGSGGNGGAGLNGSFTTFTSAGSITGGDGGAGGYEDKFGGQDGWLTGTGGNGGVGATGSFTAFNDSGSITGGDGGIGGGNGGGGIAATGANGGRLTMEITGNASGGSGGGGANGFTTFVGGLTAVNNGGNGGYGGTGLTASASSLVIGSSGNITGGAGGAGGVAGGVSGSGGPPVFGDAGNGGHGGDGISGMLGTFTNDGSITGGSGGRGGYASNMGGQYGPVTGSGGNGGAGVSGSFNFLSNAGSILGGSGGSGGGNGGAGVSAASAGANGFALATSGTITGGNGGSGAQGAISQSATTATVANNGGKGGYGGAGLTGVGATLDITAGSIAGGNGGLGGAGGAALGNSGKPAFGTAGNGGDGGDGVSGAFGAFTSNANINGGNGGAGGYEFSLNGNHFPNTGIGGNGGAGVNGSFTTFSSHGNVTGGNGGVGGGNGGDGINATSTSGGSLSMSISGSVAAGDGGVGSHGGVGFSSGLTPYNDGGRGGDGGIGLTGSAAILGITDGNIAGGNGGAGGTGGYAVGAGYTLLFGNAGDGGDGGAGISGSSGTSITLSGATRITGGDGGTGGYGVVLNGTKSGPATNSTSGVGGDGVSGSGFALAIGVGGSISGGNGGDAVASTFGIVTSGNGGGGVVATGLSSVTDAGSISGGLADGGSGALADAVDFSGGGNTLTLENGYSLVGDVVSSSGSANGGDTFALGGDSTASGGTGNGTFDLSEIVTTQPASWTGTPQFHGFSHYKKTGTSTWTLTGVGVDQDWQLLTGTLQVGGTAVGLITGSQGASGSNAGDGGIAVTGYTGTTLIVGAGSSLNGGPAAPNSSGANGGIGVGGNGFVMNNVGVVTGGLGAAYNSAGGGGVSGTGFTLDNTGTVSGGVGAPGGTGNLGGTGGVGVGGSGFTVTNTGTVNGGTGGGYSGAGGVGVGGSGFSLTNQGTINGGSGGYGVGGVQRGNGGAGVAGSGFMLANAGTINGGTSGSGIRGTGGVGVAATGNATIVSAGSVNGALLGSSSKRADAVDFSGGGNTLTLENGFTFIGNVVSTSGAINGGDTLALGGDSTVDGGTGNGRFDVSNIVDTLPADAATTQYVGFAHYEKTGTSTWTLIGSGRSDQDWSIVNGTLQGDATVFAGSIGLHPAAGDTAAVVFDQGSNNPNSPATATYAGAISGDGSLTKIDDGTLVLTGDNTYSGGTTISAGTLQAGDDGTAGSIGTGNVTDNGALDFDRSDNVTFAGAISGSGALAQQGNGTLTLDGDSAAFAGASEVKSGTLIVGSSAGNGAALGGDVAVDGGATLGGHGSIGGDVDLSSGAILSPGDSIGTLTVGHDLDAAAGSYLDFEFGAPGADFQTFGTGDSVQVGGALSLAGSTLNVTDAGGLGPGLYNLFSYGSLTTSGCTEDEAGGANGCLAFGNTPAGSKLVLQYLTAAGQINLFDATGVTLNVWNANGKSSSTQMGGGSGTWSATSPEWTDATGIAPNSAMSPHPGFAVFGGAPGTVTVDDRAGTVSALGMQFAVDGYTLTGNTLALVASNGAAPILRVGDGSSAGAAMTATIDNVIGGTVGVAKTDLGTLVLAGANTFSGDIVIDGGTLSVSSDANLGDVANAVIFNGGTLANTAAFTTARNMNLAGNGTLQTNADLIDSGVIAGAGALTKSGSATLTLTGASTFAGGTMVRSGALIVGDDAHQTASLAGPVTVAGGATLGGFGTVGGLDLSGTLNPGDSIGTFHVAGNATFEQGSTFEVGATPAGRSDQLAVTGNTILKGGNTVVLAQAGNWAPRTTYTILTSGGGVTGTFGAVSDSLAFLDAVLSYQPDAVNLTLTRNDINFNKYALTPNQHNTATAENGLGFGNSLYDALVNLDATNAPVAFDQTSGEIHASQQTARIDNSRYVREAMTRRLVQGDADAEAAKLRGSNVTAWAHAWGHWGTVDGDGNAAKLSDNGDGLLIGADLPVGTQGRVGITGGSSRDSVSVNLRDSWGRLTSTWLGAFGGFQVGAFALRGGVAYGWDQIPVNRVIGFQGLSDRVSGSSSGDTLTSYLEGAWTIQVAGGDIDPFLNVAHTRVETDSSTEVGAAAALQVDSDSMDTTFGTVGARGSLRVTNELYLHGELGWQHAFGDITPASTQAFASGGASFTVYGVPVAKNAGLGRVGVAWHPGQAISVDADYEGLMGGGVKDNAAKLSFDVKF